MARYEQSRERSSPRREGRSRGGFRDGPSRGGYGRDRPSRGGYGRDSGRGRPRREVEMTQVTCSECGKECEVPFKPTSSKPVYCDDCFGKKEKGGSGKVSSKDLEVINEKLDKIMAALKIETASDEE